MTTPSLRESLLNRRILICVATGFSSGLPLFLLISLMPAWLREGGVNLKSIGLMALVQFPYIWKFLWAPLCDRYGFALGLAPQLDVGVATGLAGRHPGLRLVYAAARP